MKVAYRQEGGEGFTMCRHMQNSIQANLDTIVTHLCFCMGIMLCYVLCFLTLFVALYCNSSSYEHNCCS